MFSQACVKNSVYRGQVYTPPGHTHTHTHPGHPLPWTHRHPWRHTHPLDTHTPLGHTHPWSATAANSTHPTGMHSFFIFWRTSVLFVGPLIPLFWTSDICPEFQSHGGSPHLHSLSPAYNGILRFPSGVTPADLLSASMAAEPHFIHIFVQV